MTVNSLTTKLVYAVDAIGSLVLGGLLIAFATPLAAEAGPALPELAVLVIGIGLLPWAAFNLWIATRPAYPRRAVALNVIGDVAWVVASIALIIFSATGLTMPGTVVITLVGFFVAVVCAIKMLGLRQGALAA